MKNLSVLPVSATLLLVPIWQVTASTEAGPLEVHYSTASNPDDDYIRDNEPKAPVSSKKLQAAAEEGRSGGAPQRTRRQSSTALARRSSASTGLLSALPGTRSKHAAFLFLIAALSSMLLRVGTVSKGPSTDDGEIRPTVAPAAGLPSRLSSNKLLIGFLALLLIASSLAYEKPKYDAKPEVKVETDGNGDHIVVIGEGWVDEYGFTKQANEHAQVTFDGQKYKLFMSKDLKKDLGTLLGEVTDMLRNGPGVQTQESEGWQWGWKEGARLYYRSSGAPVHKFFLSSEVLDRLYRDGLPQESEWDLYYLLSTFARQLHKRTTTAGGAHVIEGLREFDGQTAKSPIDVTSWGDTTTAGKTPQDYTRNR